jgi:molybdate transport system substrate-binding protein
MSTLDLISAGAAKGLVQELETGWNARTGTTLAATFGAVGAMKEHLLGGAACDVLILTQPMLEDLARHGEVAADSIALLGRVYTGIAVPAHATTPKVDTPEALRTVLHDASAIYFPDPHLSTAGIHFTRVLAQLGITDAVAPRLRPFPNGAAAMRAMGEAGDRNAIGCTQVTEILYTPGVEFVARLPRALELSTLYSAAVCTRARSRDLARDFIVAIAGGEAAESRRKGGFEANA